MILHVKEVKYLRDYVIWVRFNDGAEGEVDLADELEGEVFGPLKKMSVFKAVRVHPVFQTVVWPNDADFAPDFLYERMTPGTCERVSVTNQAVRERSDSYGRGKRTPKR